MTRKRTPVNRISSLHRELSVAAPVAALVALGLHAAGFDGPFVSDDLLYLTHNEALALPLAGALRRAFSTGYFVVGNWSPLHQLFLWIEWNAFGESPLPYRVVNALLHAGVALAMGAAARRVGLGRRAAWVAAGLFLVHPVAAEPVGWINQSKTLLAALLCLIATERWLAHLAAPAASRLLGANLAGGAAVLVKPAALPLIAILGVATAVKGASLRRAAADLLPLAFASAVAFWLGLLAQAAQGGVAAWFGGSPAATARVLPELLWRYVRLVVLPVDLVHGVHPEPIDGWLSGRVLGPSAGLLAVAVGVTLACRTRREGWLAPAWFLLMLAPVLQIVPMINLFADRYLYMALPAALAGLAALGARVAARGSRLRLAVGVVALAWALGLAALSAGRAALWADPEALYAEAVAAYPSGRTGWTGLGALRHARGDLDGAAQAYLGSLRVHREDGHVRHLLARVRVAQRRLRLALYDAEESLRLTPAHHDVRWTRRTAERLRARGVVPRPDEPE